MAIFFDGDRRLWYRFETDGETITLIVDGSRTTEWLAWLRTDDVQAMNASLAAEYELRPFVVDQPFTWGYGGCGRYDGEHSEEWDRLSMPIPSMNLDKDKPDYLSAYESAFSMELLLRFLNRRGPNGNGRVQGLCPALGTVPHAMHGGQISAQLSPSIAKWCLETLAQGDLRHIELEGRDDVISMTMRKACARIWGSGKRAEDNLFDATSFTLLYGRPYFSGGISGNVAMNGSATVEESGAYEITPHNCDGPIAQFTILAGIAKFDQLFHER